jgi:hypothetical protein
MKRRLKLKSVSKYSKRSFLFAKRSSWPSSIKPLFVRTTLIVAWVSAVARTRTKLGQSTSCVLTKYFS